MYRLSPLVARLIAMMGIGDIAIGAFVLHQYQETGDATLGWIAAILLISGVAVTAGFLWLSIWLARRGGDD